MKALVTGIKPYLARLRRQWTDHNDPPFDAFEPIRTKQQVVNATRFNGNTGNYFIGEGAIESAGRDKATFADFGFLHSKTRDADYLASINSQFDCVVFATANLLRSDYDAKGEAQLLSRFSLPVIVLGIGCQRAGDLEAPLPEGTVQFIEMLKSKDHHIFARGSTSADYLISQGLRQVWATGCPSMFVRPHNIVAAIRALKAIDWTASLRILFSGYIGHDRATVNDIRVFADRQRNCNYVLQDEHLFSKLELDAAEDECIYNDFSGELSRCRFQASAAIEDVRLRLFFNTHQWRALAAAHDVSFGRRFHGVVAGLQAGIPGLMIAIDDRMREMVSQLGLPYVDLADWKAARDKLALLNRIVDAFDAERFSDQHLGAAELFHKRLSALGLGSVS